MGLFDTKTMMKAVRIMKPPKRFIIDMFFRGVKEYNTKSVKLDVMKGKRRIAPYVNPKNPGRLVERSGFTSETFEPPYLKPKMITDAGQFLTRSVGEDDYSGLSPTERAANQLREDIIDIDNQISRREEEMASQIITTGKVVAVGDGINATIDFGLAGSHIITLTGTDKWNDAASKPSVQCRQARRLSVQDSGYATDFCILGQSSADAFQDNADVLKKLDNLRVEMGQIKPELLPNGAVYIGHYEGHDFYSYDEWYLDENGVEQPMIPVDAAIFLSSKAADQNHMAYGAIQDLNSLVPTRLFLKSWEEEDPSVRYLLGQSAPLPIPYILDAIVKMKVV